MKKIFCLLCLFFIVFSNDVIAEEPIEDNSTKLEQEETQIIKEDEIVTLEKCIDGDSAKFKSLDGTIITYRFLSIDAPEIANLENEEEYYALEASKYTCDKLTMAEEIKLEFDEKANEVDAYERGLAWVFVDGILLQEDLVEKGYAKVGYLYDDYKYNNVLQEKENIAKMKKVGIWSEKEKEEPIKQEQTEDIDTTNQNFFTKLINDIVDSIVASLNNFINSILQRLEDML